MGRSSIEVVRFLPSKRGRPSRPYFPFPHKFTLRVSEASGVKQIFCGTTRLDNGECFQTLLLRAEVSAPKSRVGSEVERIIVDSRVRS